MSDRQRLSTFWIGAVAFAGVAAAAYWFVLRSSAEDRYQDIVARVGEEASGQLISAVIPVALAKTCHDRFGQDDSLVRAVAEYLVRNQDALSELYAALENRGTLSDDEKATIEEVALTAAEAETPDSLTCHAMIERIGAGTYDLPVSTQQPGTAQSNGA